MKNSIHLYVPAPTALDLWKTVRRLVPVGIPAKGFARFMGPFMEDLAYRRWDRIRELGEELGRKEAREGHDQYLVVTPSLAMLVKVLVPICWR